ncbi:hypothetical protein Vretimale_17651, partial [Volvox reticuliferus]
MMRPMRLPVSKDATLRTLLSVVAERNLALHQWDVGTAFLNAKMEEVRSLCLASSWLYVLKVFWVRLASCKRLCMALSRPPCMVWVLEEATRIYAWGFQMLTRAFSY